MFESASIQRSHQHSDPDVQSLCTQCLDETSELIPGSDGMIRCLECHYEHESECETIDWHPCDM